MFALKPDYELARRRIDAWWRQAVLDRPLVHVTAERPNPGRRPVSRHASFRDRWLDVEFATRRAMWSCQRLVHLGEAIPCIEPTLGPDVLASFFGCELGFAEGTTWSHPILDDWERVDEIQFDEHNIYYRKMWELVEAYLAASRGTCVTTFFDYHTGGDLLSALRGPERLALDMIEHPDEIKRLLARLQPVWLDICDRFEDRLIAAGLPISNWIQAFVDRRYYVIQNDFSALISPRMFNETFLPGIVRECRYMDHSIYHLDGPCALQHLDALLSIPELDAIQWVCGAGKEELALWINVYKRIQEGGKSIIVYARPDELDLVFKNFRPEGCWVWLRGTCATVSEAEAIVKRVARWT